MEVGTHLDGAVAGVADYYLGRISAFIVGDRLVTQNFTTDAYPLFRGKSGGYRWLFCCIGVIVFAMAFLFYRMMNTYQTATVSEDSFDLNQADHICHSFHHIVFG